jgi:cell division protein FtsW
MVISVGAMLITTASPAVAERLGLHPFYFVHRQFIFLFLAVIIMLIISTFSEKMIKRFALGGFILFLTLMVAVLFIGDEAKGAKRWMTIYGFSLQPSEFIKPFFALITGLILSERYTASNLPGFTICSGLYLVIAILLILQPDIGMTISITAVTATQFFLAGLPIVWIAITAILTIFGAFAAYLFLPHVARRIDSFLNPQETENYQVEKSLEAYLNGGLFGKGPGEGVVKSVLPDSHTDFIFAVAGEELGAIFTTMIIILFFLVVLRGFSRLIKENNLFYIYSTAGLLMYFALQSIFNIGVTLHLFPTKGMTLPFISYGGSSVLSFAVTMGMCLSLTRRRYSLTPSGRKR